MKSNERRKEANVKSHRGQKREIDEKKSKKEKRTKK